MGWFENQKSRDKALFWLAVGTPIFAGVWALLVYFDVKDWFAHFFTKEATYRLCTGDKPESCSGRVYIGCGTNPIGWAKVTHPDVCKYVNVETLTGEGGGHCGYANLLVSCSTSPSR